MGTTDCPETSVSKYKHKSRNIPEEKRRSHELSYWTFVTVTSPGADWSTIDVLRWADVRPGLVYGSECDVGAEDHGAEGKDRGGDYPPTLFWVIRNGRQSAADGWRARRVPGVSRRRLQVLRSVRRLFSLLGLVRSLCLEEQQSSW